jgi:hypothetical protein
MKIAMTISGLRHSGALSESLFEDALFPRCLDAKVAARGAEHALDNRFDAPRMVYFRA